MEDIFGKHSLVKSRQHVLQIIISWIIGVSFFSSDKFMNDILVLYKRIQISTGECLQARPKASDKKPNPFDNDKNHSLKNLNLSIQYRPGWPWHLIWCCRSHSAAHIRPFTALPQPSVLWPRRAAPPPPGSGVCVSVLAQRDSVRARLCSLQTVTSCDNVAQKQTKVLFITHSWFESWCACSDGAVRLRSQTNSDPKKRILVRF